MADTTKTETPIRCPDLPKVGRTRRICLSAVSKDLESGSLGRPVGTVHKCKLPACTTLATRQGLRAKVQPHDCDSGPGKRLDGIIVVNELQTVFEQDGTRRGVHAGNFVWRGKGFEIRGRMSGVTNLGTHRKPAFEPCQRCDERGVMEGRLCGKVRETSDPALRGCELFGAYRLRLLEPPSPKGVGGKFAGVFEGVIACPCK